MLKRMRAVWCWCMLHGLLPVVGNAHHDDVLVLRQMVHLVLVHLLVLAFAQYKIDALVRLEESTKNLLSLVLVFCGEHVFQVVFQVVLRELCHNADVIFSVKKEVVWRAKKRASLRLWCPLLVYGLSD